MTHQNLIQDLDDHGQHVHDVYEAYFEALKASATAKAAANTARLALVAAKGRVPLDHGNEEKKLGPNKETRDARIDELIHDERVAVFEAEVEEAKAALAVDLARELVNQARAELRVLEAIARVVSAVGPAPLPPSPDPLPRSRPVDAVIIEEEPGAVPDTAPPGPLEEVDEFEQWKAGLVAKGVTTGLTREEYEHQVQQGELSREEPEPADPHGYLDVPVDAAVIIHWPGGDAAGIAKGTSISSGRVFLKVDLGEGRSCEVEAVPVTVCPTEREERTHDLPAERLLADGSKVLLKAAWASGGRLSVDLVRISVRGAEKRLGHIAGHVGQLDWAGASGRARTGVGQLTWEDAASFVLAQHKASFAKGEPAAPPQAKRQEVEVSMNRLLAGTYQEGDGRNVFGHVTLQLAAVCRSLMVASLGFTEGRAERLLEDVMQVAYTEGMGVDTEALARAVADYKRDEALVKPVTEAPSTKAVAGLADGIDVTAGDNPGRYMTGVEGEYARAWAARLGMDYGQLDAVVRDECSPAQSLFGLDLAGYTHLIREVLPALERKQQAAAAPKPGVDLGNDFAVA